MHFGINDWRESSFHFRLSHIQRWINWESGEFKLWGPSYTLASSKTLRRAFRMFTWSSILITFIKEVSTAIVRAWVTFRGDVPSTEC